MPKPPIIIKLIYKNKDDEFDTSYKLVTQYYSILISFFFKIKNSDFNVEI